MPVPWVLGGYLPQGSSPAVSVVNTHFTASVTRMYALRFLHDVRSVWAPVMEALGQVHPSTRWDHDEYLHSLSAERLVCLVQAQHQQLCFTGQITHALYQQFPRYLAKPPSCSLSRPFGKASSPISFDNHRLSTYPRTTPSAAWCRRRS